jgi:CheY-like chemotaxis protein
LQYRISWRPTEKALIIAATSFEAHVVARSDISGLRVLVVEDEAMAVMLLEDVLEQFGCDLVGIAPRVGLAQKAVKIGNFDCAILDVNVHGQPVYPVARELDDRGIPYVLMTGYSREDIEEPFRDRLVLYKPFEPEQLRAALARTKK